MCDNESVVGHRDVLILRAGDAVLHFPFIEHAAAAVDDQVVAAQVKGELPSAGETELNVVALCELAYPMRQLDGADIVALPMMGASF